MAMTKADQKRIADAIRAAEARTSGEIVCVLARRSADYATIPIAWAAALALAVPWPLIALTQWPVEQIFIAQLATFVVFYALFNLPRVRDILVPKAVRHAQAHRAATEQFVERGLTHTSGRTGILIYVSMAERYARIVADQGIAAHVHQREWQAAVDALIGHVREGRTAEGFITAIALCSDVLAKHFPREAEASDQLPDRIYLI